MNVMKSLAMATVLVGLMVNVAMGDTWCGYQTVPQPNINRDPNTFPMKDANLAMQYLDPAIKNCANNGQLTKAKNLQIKRDACPYRYEDECVRAYDALWSNPPPSWVNAGDPALACDAVPAGSVSDCACRNAFAKKVGDTTSTDNFLNGSTAGLVNGLKTLIPSLITQVGDCNTKAIEANKCYEAADVQACITKAVSAAHCDTELVGARTCCAVMNGKDCGI